MKSTKKIIASIALTLLVPLAAYAISANDINITQRNSTNTGNVSNFVSYPSGVQAALGMDGTTNLPYALTFGSNLTVTSGVLSATVPTSVSAFANDAGYLTTAATTAQGAKADTALQNITGLVTAGTGVTLGGAGTAASPYSITAASSRSVSSPVRALNTCFQASSTRDAFVNYSVDVAATLSLTTGQSGTVALKTFTNNTCTTGAVTVQQFTNANTGTLAIGLGLTQTITGTLSGFAPAGTWQELITTNNTGTPTFTYQTSNEALL